MDSNGNRTVEPRAGKSPYNVKQLKIYWKTLCKCYSFLLSLYSSSSYYNIITFTFGCTL